MVLTSGVREGNVPGIAQGGGTRLMSAGLKKLLTVKEVMALLGVSRSWLYDAATRGALPSIRLGGMLRFDPDQLEQWLRQLQRSGGATYGTQDQVER
jgi:excisionase family DNA binding protein